MEKLLSDRENLQDLINLEWQKYNQAINDNKPFEEVKIIYLNIKELETQIKVVTYKIQQKLDMR